MLTIPRRPFLVTVSLAALTPCCQSEPARPAPPASTSVRPTAVIATNPPAPLSPTVTASGRVMVEPHNFETNAAILNPRLGDKVVFLAGKDRCYTLGPEDQDSSGISFARQPVPCPTGIDATLANCTSKLLTRAGDQCSCEWIEGNPPPPPSSVDCPG